MVIIFNSLSWPCTLLLSGLCTMLLLLPGIFLPSLSQTNYLTFNISSGYVMERTLRLSLTPPLSVRSIANQSPRPVNFTFQEVLASTLSSPSLIFLWQKTTQSQAQTLPSFTNWALLLIYPLHDIQNSSVASSEPFHDFTWESPSHEPFNGSQWPWRESKFLNVDSKALHCMAPDFHQSFNCPIILRHTPCELYCIAFTLNCIEFPVHPELYSVPSSSKLFQIPMPVVMSFPLPGMPLLFLLDSLVLMLWLAEAPGLDQELKQQHLPTSRSETSPAASLLL